MNRSRHQKRRTLRQGEGVESTTDSRQPRIGVALVLALVCLGVYLTSLRAPASWDTIPSRLLPFSILREGNLDLDEFGWLFRLSPSPYFLRRTSAGHWISAYPIATPLVGTPIAIPALWWLDRQGISDDDVRFRLVTILTERVTAALIVAVSVAVLCLTLMRLTSVTRAVLLTLIYALGTNSWATSSQAMWQHGLAELSLGAISFFLLGPDTRRNAFGASAFAALGVMARPTMVIFALLALAYMWRSRRGNLASFLLVPVVGALALLAYNIGLVGGIAGAYASKPFSLPSIQRFAGLLVSPSRGLLIYTPFAALAAWGTAWRPNERQGWLLHLAVGIGTYLLLYSCYEGWYGGSVYGPRMLVDVMPAVILCAVPATEKLLASQLGKLTFAVLALWSVAVQVIGVYFDDNLWNSLPSVVDDRRVWNWRDPQILRAARSGWHGTDLGPVLWQAITDPRQVLLRVLDRNELAGAITTADELPRHFRRGRYASVHILLSNRSSVPWPAFSDYGYLDCEIAYRWWKNGTVLQESGWIPLPRNLGPGESEHVSGWVRTPEQTGRAELELLLIQVLNTTTGGSGGASLRIPVEVE